jgi:antitoxin (DNA-binding transcriptional repressor) of toxin-antitoxin stability system
MSTISVQDIRRDPLGFLHRIEAGETLLVVKDEHPIAEVRPVPPPSDQPRPYGLCAGSISLPKDFNDPLPEEILKEFEGQ